MNVARTGTSVVADRIRIEDEVWEEAFATRIRSRPRRLDRNELRPVPARFAESVDQARLPEPDEEARMPSPATEGIAESPPRRTIHIQGRGAERNLPVARPYSSAASRRHRSLVQDFSGFRPDRLAMWAMLLGVALMAIAILSSGL